MVNKLIQLDKGLRVLRILRSSHQLGYPTWFCSLSAAESRWIFLLHTLNRLVDNKNYNDDKIDNVMATKFRPYSEGPCYFEHTDSEQQDTRTTFGFGAI